MPAWFVGALLCVWGALFSWPAEAATGIEIAILNSSDIAAYQEAMAGFKSTGPRGALYTQYDLHGDFELGKKLARKIRASDPGLVLAVGLKAALAAKMEIVDTPVVYMMILDPLKHHLVAPNMTGTMLEVTTDRQLKLIHTFLPSIHRVGVLYDPTKSASKVKEAAKQAAAIGMTLLGYPVSTEKEIPSQLRVLLGETEALWLLTDSTVLTNESINFLIQSALAEHVPVIGFSAEFIRLGGFLGISVNYGEVGRETGVLAKRILDGERINPLRPMPIGRLTISVNLKTARFLGVAVPPELNSLIDETY
ncbi:MAG: ABC transporter substrate-binding protein [Nitrospiraceae bacterium]|nr:ABC transporter substrate-binding protein [Nitrospiraceae bacterium]